MQSENPGLCFFSRAGRGVVKNHLPHKYAMCVPRALPRTVSEVCDMHDVHKNDRDLLLRLCSGIPAAALYLRCAQPTPLHDITLPLPDVLRERYVQAYRICETPLPHVRYHGYSWRDRVRTWAHVHVRDAVLPIGDTCGLRLLYPERLRSVRKTTSTHPRHPAHRESFWRVTAPAFQQQNSVYSLLVRVLPALTIPAPIEGPDFVEESQQVACVSRKYPFVLCRELHPG